MHRYGIHTEQARAAGRSVVGLAIRGVTDERLEEVAGLVDLRLKELGENASAKQRNRLVCLQVVAALSDGDVDEDPVDPSTWYEDADGDTWDPRLPVLAVSWDDAVAYCAPSMTSACSIRSDW